MRCKTLFERVCFVAVGAGETDAKVDSVKMVLHPQFAGEGFITLGTREVLLHLEGRTSLVGFNIFIAGGRFARS